MGIGCVTGSIPASRQSAVIAGTRRTKSIPCRSRASRNTRWSAAICCQTARATASRGANSAPGMSAMKRSPFSPTRVAPSPRTASLNSFRRERSGVECRRGELDEFKIGHRRAGPRREREALAKGSGRICPVQEQSADAFRSR